VSLELTEEIRERVNGALMAHNPMLLAVVDGEGRPRLSYRGSLQVFSADQLGFWARNRQGDTLAALSQNPHVALMYRDPEARAMLQFAGRARLAGDGAERDRVYESAPAFERNADPDRKGVGVIVDLDRVEGILGLDDQGRRRTVRLTRD
jgi:hypothetical protein